MRIARGPQRGIAAVASGAHTPPCCKVHRTWLAGPQNQVCQGEPPDSQEFPHLFPKLPGISWRVRAHNQLHFRIYIPDDLQVLSLERTQRGHALGKVNRVYAEVRERPDPGADRRAAGTVNDADEFKGLISRVFSEEAFALP